jgi:hypothetical protein
VTFIKGKEFSKIFIVIDSIISKSAEIRRKYEREEIQYVLFLDNLIFIEENEIFLAVFKTVKKITYGNGCILK